MIKHLNRNHWLQAGLISSFIAVSLSGCTIFQGKTTPGQYTDDAGVTTQIKAKMVQSDTLSAANIHVETQNHVIQMSGFVSNANQISEAQRIARSACDSCQIINDIAVQRKR